MRQLLTVHPEVERVGARAARALTARRGHAVREHVAVRGIVGRVTLAVGPRDPPGCAAGPGRCDRSAVG